MTQALAQIDSSVSQTEYRPAPVLRVLTHEERYTPNTYDERIKPIFDFAAASALLITSAPVFALTALAVRLSSRGPIVFRQTRLTKGGKIFTLYKFRTMNCNAEQDGACFAGDADPRITKVGAILRQTRLDELPQLINVLKGEMSLIGPRPERPEFSQVLNERIAGFNRRTRVKAGITGLAQVSNGYASDLLGHKKKLAYDLLYIRKQSFLLDLSIAIRTVVVMLTGFGAR